MIYLLIRKFHINDTNMKAEYRVEKYTDNVDEANKFLSALTLLEDSKHISWHIVTHDFNEPLVLREAV